MHIQVFIYPNDLTKFSLYKDLTKVCKRVNGFSRGTYFSKGVTLLSLFSELQ